jgi:hypothetical protein
VSGGRQRDAKLTFLGWATMDLVEGTLVSLTNTADRSRTSAGIYMHENRLYLEVGSYAYSSSVSFFRRLPNIQASPMLSR